MLEKFLGVNVLGTHVIQIVYTKTCLDAVPYIYIYITYTYDHMTGTSNLSIIHFWLLITHILK